MVRFVSLCVVLVCLCVGCSIGVIWKDSIIVAKSMGCKHTVDIVSEHSPNMCVHNVCGEQPKLLHSAVWVIH
jgi:hypothetical protein